MGENTLYIPDVLEIEVIEGRERIRERYGIEGNEEGPSKVARLFDPSDGVTWGYVVVDNLLRGRSLGGIRMAEDVDVQEIYGLASAMTLKSAAAMLPLGGGKAGLRFSPEQIDEHPGAREHLIRCVGKALWEFPDYIPGPDMGTSEFDMQVLYEVFTELGGKEHHGRGGIGRPVEYGGLPIDEWGITAHGLLAAIETAAEFVDLEIRGARVIVQGFGNVGANIALKMVDRGAVLVGASDIHAAWYDPDGLDVVELCRVRREHGGLANYSGNYERRFGSEELDRLMELPCDVLVPAARPDAVTFENAPRVKARVLLEGANNPVAPEVERYLFEEKGFVALTDWLVNAGGVIGCAVELKMDVDEEYGRKVRAAGDGGRSYLESLVYRTISKNVKDVFSAQKEAEEAGRRMFFRDAALALARSRLWDEEKRKEIWL